ncbi:MAG: UDP-N-acetylglucosamine--N-acetylmuramyl-(pentapeptide) pyrophosphoryl-undecaprenol N-acetylglucosamine transferase [Thermotogae bacterium]|nr:UDP-N-acetylglucosamine--N-acetylmuramyl-(pentapeptide) pyrophosphoryl-undecaprenol N-acetylglucosamine transferase [Thermotogota bacterium]
MKVILAGGGTGGHFYPAVAVYQELRSRFENLEAHYVAVEGGIESRQLPREYPEIFIHKVRTKGFLRPLYNPKNLLILLKNFLLFQKIKDLLKDLKPDFAFLTGGYICASVGIACESLKIPFFIHEQNYFPGMTNRFLAKKSNGIFLSFEGSKKYFSRFEEKVIISGNPVRKVEVDREKLLRELDFDPNAPFIVVMGGSRGSESINFNMMKVYEMLEEKNTNWQFIHSTGNEEIARKINNAHKFVRAFTFVDGMVKYISVANAMVSRAGATTIAEAIAYRVPVILIPWPHAVDNHQFKNAEALMKKGLAVMLIEESLTSQILFEMLWNVIVGKKGEDLRYNLSKVYFGDPTKKIVDTILGFLKSGRR